MYKQFAKFQTPKDNKYYVNFMRLTEKTGVYSFKFKSFTTSYSFKFDDVFLSVYV